MELRAACSKSVLGGKNRPVTPVLFISTISWTKTNVHLEMINLKQTELQRLKKERLRIRRENKKTENHKKQHLAILKRLKLGDDNELERTLRLEKVVYSEQLRLVVETEERRARLENDASTKRLRLAMEMEEERKARLGKMVTTSTAHVRPD